MVSVPPGVWSKYAWPLFHGMCQEMGERKWDKRRVLLMIRAFARFLPCGLCRQHLIEQLDILEKQCVSALETTTTAADFWYKWSVSLRKIIAGRVGRQERDDNYCFQTGLSYKWHSTDWFQASWMALFLTSFFFPEAILCSALSNSIVHFYTELAHLFPNISSDSWLKVIRETNETNGPRQWAKSREGVVGLVFRLRQLQSIPNIGNSLPIKVLSDHFNGQMELWTQENARLAEYRRQKSQTKS